MRILEIENVSARQHTIAGLVLWPNDKSSSRHIGRPCRVEGRGTNAKKIFLQEGEEITQRILQSPAVRAAKPELICRFVDIPDEEPADEEPAAADAEPAGAKPRRGRPKGSGKKSKPLEGIAAVEQETALAIIADTTSPAELAKLQEAEKSQTARPAVLAAIADQIAKVLPA